MATPLEQIQATLEAKGFLPDDIHRFFPERIIQLAQDLANRQKCRYTPTELNEVFRYIDFTMADDLIPKIVPHLKKIHCFEILHNNPIFADKFFCSARFEAVRGTRYYNQWAIHRLQNIDLPRSNDFLCDLDRRLVFSYNFRNHVYSFGQEFVFDERTHILDSFPIEISYVHKPVIDFLIKNGGIIEWPQNIENFFLENPHISLSYLPDTKYQSLNFHPYIKTIIKNNRLDILQFMIEKQNYTPDCQIPNMIRMFQKIGYSVEKMRVLRDRDLAEKERIMKESQRFWAEQIPDDA